MRTGDGGSTAVGCRLAATVVVCRQRDGQVFVVEGCSHACKEAEGDNVT